MGRQHLSVVTLVLALFVASSSAASCSLSTTRTPTGSNLKCACPGSHTTTVPAVASVNVEVDCMNNCLLHDPVSTVAQDGCDSGVSSTFQEAARAERRRCCSRCGGIQKGGRCNRIFLESRPLPEIDEGCASKIRGTVIGQAFQCRCATGRNFQVPFFVASGVDEQCLRDCEVEIFEPMCVADTQEQVIREQYRRLFSVCCAGTCGGVSLDGGFTCGFDTSLVR